MLTPCGSKWANSQDTLGTPLLETTGACLWISRNVGKTSPLKVY